MKISFVRRFSGSLIAALLGALLPVHSDSAPAQTATSKGSTSTQSSPSSLGFSIETEMLTYRSLESNSAAIACDIAAYLNGTAANFASSSSNSACNISNGGYPKTVGVVLLPFDHSVISDFELWRSDMQTMAALQRRVSCTNSNAPTPTAEPSSETRRGGSGGPLLAVTPAGEAANTAAEILGLFASEHTTSPVTGTIQDQALMDALGRELRSVRVDVLMPDVYSPYTFTSIQVDRSPFLTALNKLFSIRNCLTSTKGSDDPNLKDINDFLALISGSISTSKPTSTSPATTPLPSQSGSSGTPSQVVNMTHLNAVLSVDGLAQRLGADPVTGIIPDSAPQHLLFVKALESGGSILRSGNIFGSKTSYGGGSVASYALFNLNGELECSGNVYEYAGPIPSKDFRKDLRDYHPDPGTQVIFQHGSCHH